MYREREREREREAEALQRSCRSGAGPGNFGSSCSSGAEPLAMVCDLGELPSHLSPRPRLRNLAPAERRRAGTRDSLPRPSVSPPEFSRPAPPFAGSPRGAHLRPQRTASGLRPEAVRWPYLGGTSAARQRHRGAHQTAGRSKAGGLAPLRGTTAAPHPPGSPPALAYTAAANRRPSGCTQGERRGRSVTSRPPAPGAPIEYTTAARLPGADHSEGRGKGPLAPLRPGARHALRFQLRGTPLRSAPRLATIAAASSASLRFVCSAVHLRTARFPGSAPLRSVA